MLSQNFNKELMYIHTHIYKIPVFTGIDMDGLWKLLPTNNFELDFGLPQWLQFYREIFLGEEMSSNLD